MAVFSSSGYGNDRKSSSFFGHLGEKPRKVKEGGVQTGQPGRAAKVVLIPSLFCPWMAEIKAQGKVPWKKTVHKRKGPWLSLDFC